MTDDGRRSVNWLGTARWQKLRMKVLRRDAIDITDKAHLFPGHILFDGEPLLWPVCQQTGVLLTGKDPAPNSPVCDHVVPHRGDPVKFWDEGNLQTVSKEWHDKEKQSREKQGLA